MNFRSAFRIDRVGGTRHRLERGTGRTATVRRSASSATMWPPFAEPAQRRYGADEFHIDRNDPGKVVTVSGQLLPSGLRDQGRRQCDE